MSSTALKPDCGTRVVLSNSSPIQYWLTVSDAVRVFLTRVVTDQQLPFALQAPNASTRAAMREARAIGKARFASTDALIHDLEKGAKR